MLYLFSKTTDEIRKNAVESGGKIDYAIKSPKYHGE
jgi:hypothetical protein